MQATAGSEAAPGLTLGAARLSVEDYPFPQALADLSHRKATGTLTLARRGLQRRILIKDGSPVYLESNIAEESLDRFLVNSGTLDAAAAFQAKSKAVETQRSLGEVLIAQGSLGPNEVFKLMKRCMGSAILSAFRWSDGELTYDGGPVATDGKLLLEVKPGPLVVRGVFAYAPFEMISRHFLAFHCNRFRRVGDPRSFIPALRLNSLQSRIAQAVDAPCSVNELAQRAKADMEATLRVLYALLLLRIIVPADNDDSRSEGPLGPSDSAAAADAKAAEEEEPQVSRATVPAKEATPETAPPIAPRRPTALTAAEIGTIEAAQRRGKDGTFYDLLGIERTANFTALKDAFMARCHQLSPMTFAGRDLGGREGMLEELFILLVRAFSTLAVPGQRRAYDEQLTGAPKRNDPPTPASKPPRKSKGTRRRKGKTLAEELPPDNSLNVYAPHSASVAVKTAAAFLNTSQPREAFTQLERAVKKSPGDALALALLGYAKYLCDPISNVTMAVQQLHQATSLDPELPDPHLLLGRVFEQQQQREGALDAFEQCLARDPNHAEARAAATRLRKLSKR